MDETPEEAYMRQTSPYTTLGQGDSFISVTGDGKHIHLDKDGRETEQADPDGREAFIYPVKVYDPKGQMVGDKPLQAPRGLLKLINNYRHNHQGAVKGSWFRVTRQGTGTDTKYVAVDVDPADLPAAIRGKLQSQSNL